MFTDKKLPIIRDRGCAGITGSHTMLKFNREYASVQKWFMKHTFVFMWLPIVVILEMIIPIITFPLLFLTFILSWDMKYNKACKWVWEICSMNSMFLFGFNFTETRMCPYCPMSTQDKINRCGYRIYSKFHKEMIYGVIAYEAGDSECSKYIRISEEDYHNLPSCVKQAPKMYSPTIIIPKGYKEKE